MAAISTGRVVQDDDAGKVPMDHREVLNVTAQLQRAVLGAGLMLDTPPPRAATPPQYGHTPSGTALNGYSQWGERSADQ